ncbi:MAG TPA: FtsX-like permease family protein, partial [Vicinamibacterales bacterium]|nr:FtsX-like permease family protein [Vicinamibacterales bacterium]
VTSTYLPLYAPRMIAGRNISRADLAGEAKVAVISEDLAAKLGGRAVLGRMLAFAESPSGGEPRHHEIVGIAPAIAATSMKQRPSVVWLPFEKENPEATVVLRTSMPPALVLPAVRQVMQAIDRNLPMADPMTMEEQISAGLQRERALAALGGGFGILALLLAVVGLYGVMAYSTSRRRGEIGLRLALGAMPRDIARLVLREGLAMAVLGILAGAPIVWIGAKYVEKELFQAKPLEVAPLSLALTILLAAALVAVLIPALRASMLQPSQTLRQE